MWHLDRGLYNTGEVYLLVLGPVAEMIIDHIHEIDMGQRNW